MTLIRTLLTAIVVALVATPPAAAATTVKVLDQGFDPAVKVVAPGTEVVWHNEGAGTHSVVGEFASSPQLQPGREFRHTFRRIGEYRYHDGQNQDIEGTILVLARSRRPGPPPGGGGSRARGVRHRYRGTLSVAMRESAIFWDSKYHSRNSACNWEVGESSRTVSWKAKLRGLRYFRLAGFEGLTSSPSPARLGTFRELVDAKVADVINGPFTPICPDGSQNDGTPVHEVKCSRDLAGKPLKISLGWGPKSSRNRIGWSNSGPDVKPDEQCGESYMNTGTLVGIRGNELRVNLTGDRVLTDLGNAGAATPGEVRALRRGRALTVRRKLELNYTTDCCSGFNNRTVEPTGTNLRVAEIRRVKVVVTIKLKPR